MKNLKASAKKIAEIIKKNVDIVEGTGYVAYSSEDSRTGTVIQEFDPEKALALDKRGRYYVYIDEGSFEEISLAGLILKDKLHEGTADSYQQFLINILDGYDDFEENRGRFDISCDSSYLVYSISLMSREHFADAYTLISNSFYEDKDVWVFPYKYEIILLQKAENFSEHIGTNARTIKDMVNSEIYTDIHIGVGGIHQGLSGIRKSYLEAKRAIDVGRVFNLPENIYLYKDMLAERIINMIPLENIEELGIDVLTGDIEGVLDGEMIKTIEVLFKNNLNISDSSRILYIHRNTLLYRMDKIQKATGLDIRKFEDAVILKLIMLLKARRQ